MPGSWSCGFGIGALVTGLLGFPQDTFANPSLEETLDRHVREEMRLNDIPGVSLVVVRTGEVVYGRAFGVGDLDRGDPMTLDTPVEVASLSKSLTALAVLKLAAEGGIDLDLPVGTYLSGFQTSEPERSKRITILHLLGHRSGLSRQADRLLPCCGQPGDLDLSLAVRRFARARLSSSPGTEYRYANSNFVLLAALVEKVSGQPFARFMKEQVFDSLGMNRTTLDLESARAMGLAPLHERIWGRVRVSPSRYRGWYGSSAVKSTARDMSRYMLALLSSKPPLGPLVPLRDLCRDPRVYQFGWEIQPINADVQTCTVRHTGKIWGSNTALVLVPELHLGVVVLINSGVYRAEAIADAVLLHLLDSPAAAPARMAWSTIPDNWAMLFTLASVVMLAGTMAYAWRGGWQLHAGERVLWKGVGSLRIGRSVLLALMSLSLLQQSLGGSPWSRPSLPVSIQTAFPLFATSVGVLLLAAAFFGLAPRAGLR